LLDDPTSTIPPTTVPVKEYPFVVYFIGVDGVAVPVVVSSVTSAVMSTRSASISGHADRCTPRAPESRRQHTAPPGRVTSEISASVPGAASGWPSVGGCCGSPG
jgi:hypothetical protein